MNDVGLVARSVWIDRHSDTWNANVFEFACKQKFDMRFEVHFDLGLGFKGQKELFTMMNKNNKKSYQRPKWRGFVNINLTEHDKEAFHEWVSVSASSYDTLMGDFLSAGHKVTISWDERSQCFMSALRCDDTDNVNAGLCVTSRSGDLNEVLWMSLYKHYVVCEGDWSQYFRESPGPIWG